MARGGRSENIAPNQFRSAENRCFLYMRLVPFILIFEVMICFLRGSIHSPRGNCAHLWFTKFCKIVFLRCWTDMSVWYRHTTIHYPYRNAAWWESVHDHSPVLSGSKDIKSASGLCLLVPWYLVIAKERLEDQNHFPSMWRSYSICGH